MTEKRIGEAELIINPDGSIYHLQLKPGEVADTIITVGDPDRVPEVSKYFDNIQHKNTHREFVIHTGHLNNKRITVLSTGMGTDNIDIAFNEIDALVNIDFSTRQVKKDLTQLQIIRLGTSGSVNEEVDIDTVVISENAIGMDGLMQFYKMENSIWETVYLEAFNNYLRQWFTGCSPYMVSAGEEILNRFEVKYKKATTITASGFYAPQGRQLRAANEFPDFVSVINKFRHKHFRITNLEMETAGIYGFGRLFGHQCLSVNAILANRINNTFSQNPAAIIDKMIKDSLEIITA